MEIHNDSAMDKTNHYIGDNHLQSSMLNFLHVVLNELKCFVIQVFTMVHNVVILKSQIVIQSL